MMFSGMAWNCKAAMFFAAYPVLNFTFTSRCQPDVSQTTSLGGSGNSTWIDGSLSFLAVRRAENSCFHLSFLRITILSLLLILSCIMIASQQLATSFPIWHLRQSLFLLLQLAITSSHPHFPRTKHTSIIHDMDFAHVRSQEKSITALETKSVARAESLALAPLVGTVCESHWLDTSFNRYI